MQHILCMIFPEKYLSCYILLTDQMLCLTAYTSRDIGQYVYLNSLNFRASFFRAFNFRAGSFYANLIFTQMQKI